MIRSIERAVFGHRGLALAFFALATLVLGWKATGLRIDAGFEKLLPLTHPYVQTFLEHQHEFGGANRLLIAVRAKEGDIFTPEAFQTIEKVTDAVFFLPGVNRSTVQSIFTPNVRFIEIVEGGFAGGNVVPADFQPTPSGIERVRENILKAGIVGRLVANDFTAALITAQLVEIDPATGERLDYLEVAEHLEERLREPYAQGDFDIHIIGFAKTMGDIAEGASDVALFFLLTLAVSIVLLYVFTHSFRLTLLLLGCSILAVVWSLGLLVVLGYGLDPMSLLVPFLIFAIAVSHGVQMVNAYGAGVFADLDSLDAARRAFRRLAVPGSVAILSDTVGFLTLLLIGVRIIQELAITAALGVLVIILTHLILLPVLLSYIRLGADTQGRIRRGGERREPVWRFLSGFATRRYAVVTLLVVTALGISGLFEARDLQIGDSQPGVPELRPDSRYNRDTAVIVEKFSIGLDIITTIVETVPDGCIDYEIMRKIDEFQWRMSHLEGVQSTLSLPQVAKVVHAGWNEGNLKWRALPRNPQQLSQAVSSVDTSSGLLDSDCSVMPVMIFLEDHRAETLERVVHAVEAFAAENDEDRHRFRLATGNAGVMAATNQVVQSAQTSMLLYVYGAVVLLCFVTFRSIRAVVCIVGPLTVVSVLGYALMSRLDIGLKTSTLPVAALGVGIGVDYGIYIFSRMRASLEGQPLRSAYLDTLRLTGNAVLVTGLTLAIGVSTWMFSALKFQADMGILLTFMFLANMIGAVLVLPAVASFLYGGKRS